MAHMIEDLLKLALNLTRTLVPRWRFDDYRSMKGWEATVALGALAQESRLALFRLLVQRGGEGYSAGEISERLGIPGPTLSFHLKALTQAHLVTARKESRFIFYAVSTDRMNELTAYLTANCCSLASSASACGPISSTVPRRAREETRR